MHKHAMCDFKFIAFWVMRGKMRDIKQTKFGSSLFKASRFSSH